MLLHHGRKVPTEANTECRKQMLKKALLVQHLLIVWIKTPPTFYTREVQHSSWCTNLLSHTQHTRFLFPASSNCGRPWACQRAQNWAGQSVAPGPQPLGKEDIHITNCDPSRACSCLQLQEFQWLCQLIHLLPNPFSAYHVAFFTSQVHSSCPSGALSWQLWYRGFWRAANALPTGFSDVPRLDGPVSPV